MEKMLSQTETIHPLNPSHLGIKESEKIILDLRELLKDLSLLLRYNRDIMNMYLGNQENGYEGMQYQITYLARGKIGLFYTFEQGLHKVSFTFLTLEGNPIDLSKLTLGVGKQVEQIIGFREYHVRDLQLIGTSSQSKLGALSDLVHQLFQKFGE